MIPARIAMSLLTVACLVQATAADEAAPTTRPEGRRATLGPGVVIHWPDRVVEVEATVVLREAYLELLACSRNTKEHESILQIAARPLHVFQALGLLGLPEGRPPAYDVAARKPVPARGTRVDVRLQWVETGQTRMVDAREWLALGERQEPLPAAEWHFVGSAPRGGRPFDADLYGTVITTMPFGSSIIMLAPAGTVQPAETSTQAASSGVVATRPASRPASQPGDDGQYINQPGDWAIAAKSTAIPPIGTKVSILIAAPPVARAEAPPAPRRLSGVAIAPPLAVGASRGRRDHSADSGDPVEETAWHRRDPSGPEVGRWPEACWRRPQTPEMERRFDRVLASFEVENAQLGDALERIGRTIGATMVIDWPALESVGLAEDTTITLRLSRVRVAAALDLLLRDAGARVDVALDYELRGSGIQVSTREAIRQRLSVRVTLDRFGQIELDGRPVARTALLESLRDASSDRRLVRLEVSAQAIATDVDDVLAAIDAAGFGDECVERVEPAAGAFPENDPDAAAELLLRQAALHRAMFTELADEWRRLSGQVAGHGKAAAAWVQAAEGVLTPRPPAATRPAPSVEAEQIEAETVEP